MAAPTTHPEQPPAGSPNGDFAGADPPYGGRPQGRPPSRPCGAAADLLDWEDLGRGPAFHALQASLRDLLFRPARFFERMATSGGLREPLSMVWALSAGVVVLAFPLSLLVFALTAPDPQTAPAAVYNAHSLLPRACGFLLLLLPLVLGLGGLLLVAAGTIFHLGARPFGARNWEASVSVWCYAKSAGAAPLLVAEALACALALGCWLVALKWPDARPAAGQAAGWGAAVLLGIGWLCGMLCFLVAAVAGCTHAMRLQGERAAAGALAGVLLVALVSVLAVWLWLAVGPLAGSLGAALAVPAGAAAAVLHRILARGRNT